MMSVPSISALTAGISFSAWVTALVKKPMKPSFTPCFFSKMSLYFVRSAITALMSTSLKVVSMAAVVCASLRRRAIVWRSLVMRTRSSRGASSPRDGARATTGAATGAAAGAEMPLAMASSTSPFSTWPRLPEPATWSTARLLSASSLAAAGAGGILRSSIGGAPAIEAVWATASLTVEAAVGAEAWATAGRLGGSAGAGGDHAEQGADADGLAFLGGRCSASTPAAGAGTSTVTLSVSSSTSGSSAAIDVADLLEPLADGRLGDGFAESGDADFGSHLFACPFLCVIRRGRRRGRPGAGPGAWTSGPSPARRRPDGRCSARAGAWRRYGRAPIPDTGR